MDRKGEVNQIRVEGDVRKSFAKKALKRPSDIGYGGLAIGSIPFLAIIYSLHKRRQGCSARTASDGR